ncbi:MAG: cytochrome c4 [Gammaproteobacteria bacterium]|nr:cytochrome c4 [Gammaproteobacteria bacterium]
MNSKIVLRNIVLAGGVALSSTAWAATPSGEMLGATCAACHGTNGSSVGILPSLASTPASYFVDSMKGFKSGTRKATVMDRVAKGYSDEEIQLMGDFFEAQKVVPMKQKFESVKASQGKKLHDKYCEKCHEDGGRKPDEGGVLAGQSMIYLTFSMADFLSGDREMDKKMKRKVDELLEESDKAGIDALIHFYGSQQ